MNYEEQQIVDYIVSTIHSVHPEYELTVDEFPDYIKIYIPSGYADTAILALVHFGPKKRYIKLKRWGLNKEQVERFKTTSDNKGIIKISQWEEVKKYKDFYIPMAEYLWKTYEIEKYRELAKNRQKSELLDALGIDIDFSSSGGGISIGLKTKEE